jgi:hypothetical protein
MQILFRIRAILASYFGRKTKYPVVLHNSLYSLWANGKARHQILSLVFHLTYSMKCGERRGAYRGLVGKHEEKWQLGRPRYRWEVRGTWTRLIWLRTRVGGRLL